MYKYNKYMYKNINAFGKPKSYGYIQAHLFWTVSLWQANTKYLSDFLVHKNSFSLERTRPGLTKTLHTNSFIITEFSHLLNKITKNFKGKEQVLIILYKRQLELIYCTYFTVMESR